MWGGILKHGGGDLVGGGVTPFRIPEGEGDCPTFPPESKAAQGPSFPLSGMFLSFFF